MSAASALEKRYTLEEYFALETQTEARLEYVNGKIIVMPGENLTNVKISQNCFISLKLKFDDQDCETYIFNGKTITEKNKKYRYPDVVITCSPESDIRFVQHPCMCVEVLSDSTVTTDRGDKLREYCALPTMKHYLLVSSDEPKAELYSRNAEGWQVEFFEGLDSIISLKHFDIQLLMNEIYKNVKFGEAKSDS
jgi:Uma2 family endonuclease